MFGRISFFDPNRGQSFCGQQSIDTKDLQKNRFFAITSNRVTIGNTFDHNIRLYDNKSLKEELHIDIIVNNKENMVNSNECFIRLVRGNTVYLNGVPLISCRKVELKNNDRLTIGPKTLIFNKCLSSPNCLSDIKPEDTVLEADPLTVYSVAKDLTDLSDDKYCEPNIESKTETTVNPVSEPIDSNKNIFPLSGKNLIKDQMVSKKPILQNLETYSSNRSDVEFISIAISPKPEDKIQQKSNQKAKIGRPSKLSQTIPKTEKIDKIELKIELSPTLSTSTDQQIVNKSKPRAKRNKLMDNKSEYSVRQQTRNQTKTKSTEKAKETNVTKNKSKNALKMAKTSEISPSVESFDWKCSQIQDQSQLKSTKNRIKPLQTETESNISSVRLKKSKNDSQMKSFVQKDCISNKSRTRAKRELSSAPDSSEPVIKSRKRGNRLQINVESIEPKTKTKEKTTANKRAKRVAIGGGGTQPIEDTNKRSLRPRKANI